MKDVLQYLDWWSLIIGAILGTVLPWLAKSIFYLFRPAKQKYHLSLYREGGESTFASTVRDGISVDVRFNGEKYDGVISILNIEIINDGLESISYVNHFNRPILLKSSKFKIIGAVPDKSTPVKTTILLNEDNTVSISWDLLKRNESIKIQLIGQLIDSEQLGKKIVDKSYPSFFDSLQINVRSDCVDYILPGGVPFKMVAAYVTLFMLLIAAIHLATIIHGKPDIKEYTWKVGSVEVVGTPFFDKENNCIIISPIDSITTIDVFDFHKHPKVSFNVINVRGEVAYYSLMYLLFIAFIWIVLLIWHFSNKKEERMKVFEESKINNDSDD